MEFEDPNFDPFLYFTTHPFSNLSIEDKLKVKNLMPKPDLDISQRDGKYLRKFQKKWYFTYEWLAGSLKTNKVYCYPCFLFNGEYPFGKGGLDIIKNFHARANKHTSSQLHIRNNEFFHLMGKTRIDHSISSAAKQAAIRHNESVTKNREIVSRLLDCVSFLSRQELPFRGNDESENSVNKGNYLELLQILASKESLMKDHLESDNLFKGTSSTIQNDLIDALTLTLNEHIQEELNACKFVSVQADETTDVSSCSQMCLIVRYIRKNEIVERFIDFYDVSANKTANGLSQIILDALDTKCIKNKVISQTYDGASVMAGSKGGVQKIVKDSCPNALFIHCYAHQLNLVLMYGANHIKDVKLFVCNLTAFHSFFRRSSTRTNLLREKGFALPHPNDTRWNYHSRAVQTIKKHLKDLNDVFKYIIDSNLFDRETVSATLGLQRILVQPKFLFYLCIYSDIFVIIDHLFALLQCKISSNITLCVNEIQTAINNLKKFRNESFINKCYKEADDILAAMEDDEGIFLRKSDNLVQTAYEILDCIIVQMEIRFADLSKIEFVELLNKESFSIFAKTFPNKQLQNLFATFKNIFDEGKLKNELIIIYLDEYKHFNPQQLLEYIVDNELETVYPETTKLVSICLTIPITTASSERAMSALKRVKTYTRNRLTNKHLSNFALLAIEKGLLKELIGQPNFKNRAIEIFANQKQRRLELIFKKV